MVTLNRWQWLVLILPVATILSFLLIAAGTQIHDWGLNWIWAIVTVVLVGWRWLLVKWTQPGIQQLEDALAEATQDLKAIATTPSGATQNNQTQQVEIALKNILETAQNDPPVWKDSTIFWQRCREVVIAVSHIYYPEVKYPLLNIYIPQAYGLMRGTINDLDQWMAKLSPALNQITVGQAYQAYEVYRKLEPSARKLWQVWNWAQWLLNPAAAIAKQATQKSTNQATQQLLVNLSQLVREAALRNLCRQAVALYSGEAPPVLDVATATPALPKAKTQTLGEILAAAEPVETVETQPINLLIVGRTGAGKSSLINTLFQAERATIDLLPSTDKIQSYHWQLPNGETLTLWDTPGYEQVNRPEFRQQVLDYAQIADLLILVTPALDPALQMDVDFLRQFNQEDLKLPTITVITQVDRLRPVREWQPPYNWQSGTQPKEISIREATKYRMEQLGEVSQTGVPVVTDDFTTNRLSWGIDSLALTLIQTITPAKQLRLARFLSGREARTVAAAQIIDHYTVQMATSQGLTSLLKSPVLQFISTLTTGSPTLAYLLAEKIPIEQLPIVIGKLQIAYDLFTVLGDGDLASRFDLLSLWPLLLLENNGVPEKNAWAFGHSLVEFWVQDLSIDQLRERYKFYLKKV